MTAVLGMPVFQSRNVDSSNAQIQKKKKLQKEGRRNRSKGGGKGNIKVEPATQKNELSRKISNQEKKGHTDEERQSEKEREKSGAALRLQHSPSTTYGGEVRSQAHSLAVRVSAFVTGGPPGARTTCHTAPSIQKA